MTVTMYSGWRRAELAHWLKWVPVVEQVEMFESVGTDVAGVNTHEGSDGDEPYDVQIKGVAAPDPNCRQSWDRRLNSGSQECRGRTAEHTDRPITWADFPASQPSLTPSLG